MGALAIIHIVDDEAAMRRNLQLVIESAALPAHTYESAERFLEAADLESPGCVILGLHPPGTDEINLMKHLKASGHEIPVILISGRADVQVAIQGIKLGAMDVLQRPPEPCELLAAVRRAVEKSMEAHKRLSETAAIRRRLQSLTQRELDLLKLVVAGKSNKQSAADLGISVKTVANHRAHLMAKTQALNAADLARMSTCAGVVFETLNSLRLDGNAAATNSPHNFADAA